MRRINCIRPNRRASQQSLPRETLWVQHDEAQPDHCGMVNTEVVQRKIVFLPGEIYLPKLFNDSGGTEPAKVRVNRVEGRKMLLHFLHTRHPWRNQPRTRTQVTF